jgi:hypothetical protein
VYDVISLVEFALFSNKIVYLSIHVS